MYVVIQQLTQANIVPKFLNTPYVFEISENLAPNAIVRSVKIIVSEDKNLSFSIAGYQLELLNSDFTTINNVFDIVPNFGMGITMSTLKLKTNVNIDIENGQTRYDLIVIKLN